MRLEDAPPAGWYPDPEGTSRLRWWEGADWSDRYRALPIKGSVTDADFVAAEPGTRQYRIDDPTQVNVNTNVDTRAMVEQVRIAAREEAERAAQMFGQQARSAARGITPLITEYTSKFIRWFRIAAVVVVVALIAWIAFQTIAQVTFFEWLGDRIDNLTDENSLGLLLPGR